MNAISVTIVGFMNEQFPGWVKFLFTDAKGNVCVFEEKIPVVTSENLNANSTYPCQGILACEILSEENFNGDTVFVVTTEKPWGVESTTGEHTFLVQKAHLTSV